MPGLADWLDGRFQGVLLPLVRRLFDLSLAKEEDVLKVDDAFVVHYSCAEGGQKELAMHADGSIFSFNILLNDPAEFTGGGTHIERLGRVAVPSAARGDAVLHCGRLRHGGAPITTGERFILVVFVSLHESPRLNKEALLEAMAIEVARSMTPQDHEEWLLERLFLNQK